MFLYNFLLLTWQVFNCFSFFVFAGGTGHFGIWTGVCQRTTDSVKLLPSTSSGQWQVRAVEMQRSHDLCWRGFTILTLASYKTKEWNGNDDTVSFFINKFSSSPLTLNIWNFRLSVSDCTTLCGKLEDILTFQQGLCVALEECTK